ncbi:MAG: hypothetical protein L0H54_08365 [Alcaligenaceae bacterium]|nr:hypothetical protein [Alcaligenaceae bacterium]
MQKPDAGTGSPSTSPQVRSDHAKTVTERENALDDALDDTFPASDPVSTTTTPQPPATPEVTGRKHG